MILRHLARNVECKPAVGISGTRKRASVRVQAKRLGPGIRAAQEEPTGETASQLHLETVVPVGRKGDD